MEDLDSCIQKYGIAKIIDRTLELTELPLSRRLGFFPITDKISFDSFKTQLANFWVATEANFENDSAAFEELSLSEKNFLKLLLAIFSFQDGDIIENITMNLLLRAPTIETKMFLLAQSLMEVIHAWSYSLQIEKIFKSKQEHDEVLSAIDRLEFLKKKQALFNKYKVGNCSLAELYVVNGALEGIGFSSQFAGIFSFIVKIPKLNLDGIIFSNEKISGDESIHAQFYSAKVKEFIANGEISPDRVSEILDEFYELEIETARELLPTNIPTLRTEDLQNYVRFVTDKIRNMMGLKPKFGIENPLSYMNMIGAPILTNFFECKVGAYSQIVTPPSSETQKIKRELFESLF